MPSVRGVVLVLCCTAVMSCPTSPTPPNRCGDGAVFGDEACDTGGDSMSCDRDCTAPACGDGLVNVLAGEACDDGNGTGGDGCSPACRIESCGDGVLGGAETCDDGNTIDTDECRNLCQPPRCGDGVVSLGEACDPGSNAASCDSDCTTPVCGDGLVNTAANEACDDGNTVPGDGCSPACRLESCGNGTREGVEACDDGNQVDGDGCRNTCQLPRCGDGVVNGTDACDAAGVSMSCDFDCTAPMCGDGVVNGLADEACDDGNSVSGDGCSTTCRIESCGNGTLEGAEECDDGNTRDDDACSNFCRAPRCGDGVTNGSEVCDVASASAACDFDCTLPSCGDGRVNPDFVPAGAAGGETCDDGNTTAGDGCSATCGIESCGNGVVEAANGEQCDDGNAVDGDACRDNCQAPRCGDGVVNGTETCDSAGVATATCDLDCTTPACGDGRVNPAFTPAGGAASEACDDGNTVAGDGCSAFCAIETCGNGVVEAINFEQCDDGNAVDTDACRNTCQSPRCGDGVTNGTEACDVAGQSTTCDFDCTPPECGDGRVNTNFTPAGAPGPEACDDGNTTPGDGCSALCAIESCGNGVTEVVNGEQCDDGNGNDTDFCRNNCQTARCGDGVAGPGEVCDSGGVATTTCELGCVLPRCGDGRVNRAFTPPAAPGPEACDDANSTDGDGCSSLCQLESCGNGVVEAAAGEACDDGNSIQTDACTNGCQLARCGDGFLSSSTEACDGSGQNVRTCDFDCTVPACGDGLLNRAFTPPGGTAPESCDDGNTQGGDGCSALCLTESMAVSVAKAGDGVGTVTSSTGGVFCGTTCSTTVPAGTLLTLSAAPASNAHFVGWSGGGCSGTGPCTVTANAAVVVVATFNRNLLSVVRDGTGSGTVTASLPGINCGTDCSETYNSGTLVTLTATPGPTSTFTGWSGGSCVGTAPCTVTIDRVMQVNATFALRQFTLTASHAGTGAGSVTSAPAGLSCTTSCSADFTGETVVTLFAAPDSRSVFAGWSGSGCSGTGTCVVPMSMARSVTATFTRRTFTLSVTRAGTGTVTGFGFNCGTDCAESVAAGTVVTLTAVAGTGKSFAGWSGPCSGTATCQVTVESDVTAHATFVDNTLTVVRTGRGSGTVQSNPTGVSCGIDCFQNYNEGTNVSLTATAALGSRFVGWSGAGCSGSGTCFLTMSSPTTLQAEFVSTVDLTVNKSGTGQGTVSSSPAGIACGPACLSAMATYDDDTVVTLSAAPATGFTFGGWSGSGCSGTGTCTLTLSNSRTVTATFF